MRIIDTTQIVDPGIQQPLIGPSLDFLTQNQLETLNSIVQSLIGGTYSATQVYVLYGCVVTGVTSGAGNFAMAAGAVFYGGEVYQVPAQSTIAVGSGNAVYSAQVISNTNTDPYDNTRALDPVLFSDGNARYVHKTRTWVASVAASGSNPVSGWIYSYAPAWVAITGGIGYKNSWQDSGASNYAAGRFRKSGSYVQLGGSISSGASGQVAFTLPAGYIPKYALALPATATVSPYGAAILVDTSGNVTPIFSESSPDINLDGVRFPLD